jgi:hypothetical protein
MSAVRCETFGIRAESPRDRREPFGIRAGSARTHGSHTVAEDRDGLTGQSAGPGDPATVQGDPPSNARCCLVFRNGGPSLRVVDETLAIQVPGVRVLRGRGRPPGAATSTSDSVTSCTTRRSLAASSGDQAKARSSLPSRTCSASATEPSTAVRGPVATGAIGSGRGTAMLPRRT